MFPPIDEHGLRFSEDATKSSDIEAQLDDSVASTVPDDELNIDDGTLRPPPKPHLRPGTET